MDKLELNLKIGNPGVPSLALFPQDVYMETNLQGGKIAS